mmetsp:Transcript_3993/g.10060  ORF Transcript_3993/g.10060 Transcript_3993/m.10060 type:complete len:220 (+) Transcript_3993:601-1260(+)
MGPGAARGHKARLDLVDDEDHVLLKGQLAERSEILGRGMAVTTFSLDWFDDHGRNVAIVFANDLPGCIKGVLDRLGIHCRVVLERVLHLGKGRHGPVHCCDVELMYGFRAGARKGAKSAAMEGPFEGEHLPSRAWPAVEHRRLGLFLGDGIGPATLEKAPPLRLHNHGDLHSVFIGARPARHRLHLGETRWGHCPEACLEQVAPSFGRHHPQRHPVNLS